MTVAKLSISVPDHLASQLQQMPNVSGFVAAAIQEKLGRERLDALFREHGIDVTQQGTETMRRRLHDLQTRARDEQGTASGVDVPLADR